MALYPIDPSKFAGSPEYFNAMSKPTEAEQPDLVGSFLQQLLGALEEPDQSPEDLVPPAQGPNFAASLQNAYAFQPEEQRAHRGQMLYEQQLAAQQAAQQRPARVAQVAQGMQERRVGRLGQLINTASLMENRQSQEEYRRAQIDRLGRPQASVTRGNVRTDIGVYDPQSPTGVSDIDYQLVPQPDGTVRTVEIARRPQQVRMQMGFGSMNGEPGRFQTNPVTGQTNFDTRITQPAPMGAVSAAVNNIEAKQALDQLVGAYNTARQSFGIEYANPSVLAKTRAKLSQGLSSRQWLRDLEVAGISGPKFLQFDAARKRALNAYVKAQTGAQFRVKELDRYEMQFPLPWDDPQTAQAMLETLAASAVGKMQSLISQYGGLQNMLRAGPPEVDRGELIAPYSQVPTETRTLPNGKRAVKINGQWKVED